MSFYYILMYIILKIFEVKASLFLPLRGWEANQMADSNTHQQDPYDFLFSHSQISVGAHTQHSPDTVPQNVFHTPPENISLPSFCDQPRAATEGHVHAGTQGFVDLGMDSGLGLSEMGVGECSHGARRDALSEMDEGPVKKPKLS